MLFDSFIREWIRSQSQIESYVNRYDLIEFRSKYKNRFVIDKNHSMRVPFIHPKCDFNYKIDKMAKHNTWIHALAEWFTVDSTYIGWTLYVSQNFLSLSISNHLIKNHVTITMRWYNGHSNAAMQGTTWRKVHWCQLEDGLLTY